MIGERQQHKGMEGRVDASSSVDRAGDLSAAGAGFYGVAEPVHLVGEVGHDTGPMLAGAWMARDRARSHSRPWRMTSTWSLDMASVWVWKRVGATVGVAQLWASSLGGGGEGGGRWGGSG